MILGIDTSCYRTSAALADRDGSFFDRRVLLEAPKGTRGFRQSEGVFRHVQTLPAVLSGLLREAGHPSIDAVCVSVKPRPADASYMPVFLVGEGQAIALAEAMQVPLYRTSHQQGHIRAAMVGNSAIADRFLAVHLSGGTTEILQCDRGLHVQRIGGSGDLHAGQLIDRIGVAMGCGFPSGPEMERLAGKGRCASLFPTAIRAETCSFSGAEAQALRMLAAGASCEDVAAEVYSVIARTLAKMLKEASLRTRTADVLLCGGVASSDFLRKMLSERLDRLECHLRLFWARSDLSGDNAVGTALIGLDLLNAEGKA